MPSSLTMLLPSALGFSPHPPVSVYGTGTWKTIAAFLDSESACFATFIRSTSQHDNSVRRFADAPCLLLVPVFPFPASPTCLCPHSSVISRYRNINLLSIDYDSRPCLRPRLTQSRSALLWKPWIFGLEDSHFYLATHSGILSS